MKKVVLLMAFAITLSGCAQSSYRWTANHNDNDRYNRDNAQCQLIANNASDNTQYSQGSPSYTATTYDYGGYSTTNVDPDYRQEALNAVLSGIQQDAAWSETYRLCMESKGYRQKKGSLTSSTSTINQNYKGARRGAPCRKNEECEKNDMCSDVSKVCVSRQQWEAGLGKSNIGKAKLGTKCDSDRDCEGRNMCSVKQKLCLSRVEWRQEWQHKKKQEEEKQKTGTKCYRHIECGSYGWCSGISKTCVDSLQWEKEQKNGKAENTHRSSPASPRSPAMVERGGACETSSDCKGYSFCGRISKTCLSHPQWLKEQWKKEQKNCQKDSDCDGTDVCSDKGKVCVSYLQRDAEQSHVKSQKAKKTTKYKNPPTQQNTHKHDPQKAVTKTSKPVNNTTSVNSIEFKLKKLKDLYDKKLISKEVYNSKQKDILDAM